MNIYLLELTPLKQVAAFPVPPQAGDVVAFLRAGQDATGEAAKALEKQGITVQSLDRYFTMDEGRAIFNATEKFINTWHLSADGTDPTMYKGVSIAEVVAIEFLLQGCPGTLVRTAETCRRLIADHPEAQTFFSDMTDGVSYQDSTPVGTAARYAVEQSGLPFSWLKPINPLPIVNVSMPSLNSPKAMVIRFIGGLRPAYIWGRAKLRLKSLMGSAETPIYTFLGRGVELLIENLSGREDLKVIATQSGFPGTGVLRHDHMLAFPSLTSMRICWAMLQRLQGLANCPPAKDGPFAFNGIDLGPLLSKVAKKKLFFFLPSSAVIIAQVLKLQKLTRFGAIITNGDGPIAVRFLTRLQHDTGVPVYFSRHSMNMQKGLTKAGATNCTFFTYIVSGEDHRSEHGPHLPKDTKLDIKVIGSPIIADMTPLRKQRSTHHQKRLLILNYGSSPWNIPGQLHIADQYMIDTFNCARHLIDEGWSVSYRTHPGKPTRVEERLLNELGLSGKITIDNSPTFSDALLKCDVMVGCMTTALYQSLYAGWPIVFHTPLYDTHDPDEYLDEVHTGLTAATDIERPITRDPDTLLEAVRSSLEPDSLVSRFPTLFSTVYKKRFIGDDPANADTNIANFIARDIKSRISSNEPKRT